LLYGIFKLFSEIDINGDQQMEWSEFMQYMIDAVGTSSVPSADPGAGESVMQMIEKQKANNFSWFYMSKKPIDN
jgi:hypothetical protein